MIFRPVGAKNSQGLFNIVPGVLLLALVLLLVPIQSLQLTHHLDNTSNVYNKNLYLQELNKTQQRFKTDLLAIKEKFTRMNQQLKDTNASSSTQVIKLQETLAEQRDALYNIQKYLTIPFALKSCECLNFTDQQRKKLQDEIQIVDKQILELKGKLYKDNKTIPYSNPQCPNGDCPVFKELKREIEQMESYSQVMKETVTSECCKKINYLFRDNLAQSPSWIYANLTEQKYRQNLTQREKYGKMASCPNSLPFVNVTNNECIACPSDKPIFNLEKRQCVEGCEKQQLILNMTLHQCGHNQTCEPGNVFNNKTNKCQADLGTIGICRPDTPRWDNKNLTCQKCSENHPFYDINVKSCRNCTENQIWDLNTRTCYNKAYYHPVTCPYGFFYNTVKKHCQHNNGTITNPINNTNNNNGNHGNNANQTGTSALCPPETPYWDSLDYICAKCPMTDPHYNDATGKCQSCPNGTIYLVASRSCVAKSHNCSYNQFWDKNTSKCETITSCNAGEIFSKEVGRCVVAQEQSGQVGMCPPSTPFWNQESLSCEVCPNVTPFLNVTTHKCQACPMNSAFDISTKQCKININCPSGTQYNSAINACEKVLCPSDKPSYNYQTKECEICPKGHLYNYDTKICEDMVKEGIASVCPLDKPYWNGEILGCFECPKGRTLNKTNKKCEIATTSTTPTHTMAVHFKTMGRHALQIKERHQ